MLSFVHEPQWKPTKLDHAAFCIRVAQDNSYIACALDEGDTWLLSTATGRLSYALHHPGDTFAATALRFHPANPKDLLVAQANGTIRLWNTGGKRPEMQWETNEKNEIYALDFSKSGTRFATAGLDKAIRIYDYERHEVISSMFRKLDIDDSNGHMNRIFSLLFHPTNPNLLISAGWDDTIQFWDLRTRESPNLIFGSHVMNDSIDAYEYTLAAGSYRTRDMLQLFDIRSHSLICSKTWGDEGHHTMVNTVKFSPNGDFVIAGGSGKARVAAFSSKDLSAVGEELFYDTNIFSICLNPSGDSILIVTAGGEVYSHQILYKRGD